MILLVDQELRAANTNAVQYIHDHVKELDVVDGAGQAIVAKVAGTVVIRLVTAAARLSVVENTHTGVKETSDARLISIVGARICDFYDGTLLDLLRTEDTELNSDDRLDIRTRTNESSGHLFCSSGRVLSALAQLQVDNFSGQGLGHFKYVYEWG